MRDSREAMLVRHAEEQHGVFTLAQIRAVRLSDNWRRNRLAEGRLVLVHDRTYRFAGTPLTWDGELLAAVWAGGARGRASHRSAASKWGLAGGTTALLEITCPRFRRARHDGLIVHETKLYESSDTSVVDGIPVTSCERTLLDLGAVVPPLIVDQALDDALRRGLTTMDAVQRMLDRTARSGRNGAGVLREVLAARGPSKPAESRPERSMVRMMLRHGLPMPVLQYEVRDDRGGFLGRVDAAYPTHKVIVEYDSYEWHTGKVALDHNAPRRNRFVEHGYQVYVATPRDLRRGGGTELCAQIRAAISPRFGVRNA